MISFKYLVLILVLMRPVTAIAQGRAQEKYDSLILAAASAMNNNEFDKAKAYYQQAGRLRPSDPYPNKMAVNVENSRIGYEQKRARELQLKNVGEINKLLKDASEAIMEKKYENARTFYTRILSLNPVKSQKEFVEQKIVAINQALGISKPEATVASVTPAKLPLTDALLKAQAPVVTTLPSSNTAPTKAKNEDTVQVVRKVETKEAKVEKITPSTTSNLSSDKDNIKATSTTPSVARQPKTNVEILMEDATKAIVAKDYEGARIIYHMLLATNTTKGQKEFARQKINAIDLELKKIKTEKPKNDLPVAQQKIEETKKEIEVPLNVAANIEQKGEFKQQNNEDILHAEQKGRLMVNALKAARVKKWIEALDLYKKILVLNPSVEQHDFVKKQIADIEEQITKRQATSEKKLALTPPPNQNKDGRSKLPNSSTKMLTSAIKRDTSAATPNTTMVDRQKNNLPVHETNQPISEVSKTILSEQGRLNLLDSNNNVKLICENIKITKHNTFFKFTVVNNSNIEFKPALLLLSYIKNYGILEKLPATYISSYPNVPPRQNSSIVFVTESRVEVKPNEVFIFEMEDIAKQIKLTLNISGNTYLNKINLN